MAKLTPEQCEKLAKFERNSDAWVRICLMIAPLIPLYLFRWPIQNTIGFTFAGITAIGLQFYLVANWADSIAIKLSDWRKKKILQERARD